MRRDSGLEAMMADIEELRELMFVGPDQFCSQGEYLLRVQRAVELAEILLAEDPSLAPLSETLRRRP